MTWNSDMDAAPRDGTMLLFINAHHPKEVEAGYFEPYMWKNYVEAGDGLYRLVETPISEWNVSNFHRMTHWMRMPDAPPPPGENQ